MTQERNYPIRVAQVIGKLNAAGVEAVINNYYRHINHDLIQFDYYIDEDSNFDPPQELVDMGARYFVIPPYQKLPQYIKELIKKFKENKYEIVHINMNTLSVFALFAAWVVKVPVRINHNHSTASKGETKRNILKYILRPFAKIFATDYFACSNYAGKWLFGERAIIKGDVKIFNNAIDVEKFKYNEIVRQQVRKELQIEDKFVVGHVGRFCFQKNHDFLLDIFNDISKVQPNAVLMLIGVGDLQDNVRRKVEKLQLQEKVLFLGARSDVHRFYQGMDAFVLPSHYEGLGLVGIEAQAASLPCFFFDKIPEEAKVLKMTELLSLKDSSLVWAETILKSQNNQRASVGFEIQEAGFDIEKESKKLEDYYLGKISNSLNFR